MCNPTLTAAAGRLVVTHTPVCTHMAACMYVFMYYVPIFMYVCMCVCVLWLHFFIAYTYSVAKLCNHAVH